MSSRTKWDSIQGVHNVPTVTTQSMDTFKSSLEEGNDAIMLAGGRKKITPKKKDAKDITQFRTISLLNVEGNIFFLCTCQETDKVYDRQQLCRHYVSSIQVHFPN